MDYRSSSLLSVSCYRLVTNFQETNRQQETHARRDERTVTSKHLFHVERSLLIPNFFINLLNRFHLRGPPVLHLGLVKYYTIMLEDRLGERSKEVYNSQPNLLNKEDLEHTNNIKNYHDSCCLTSVLTSYKMS
jgi:hypothetical protein